MSWKRRIRPAVDRVAQYTGVLQACERRMRSGVTVLMYHRVLEDADCADYPFPSLVMPRSLFEAQVSYLAEHARVLPLHHALRELEDSSRASKPLVSLTFDDGYADNFEIVAPLLEQKGLRGTFFITAGAVRDRKPLWYDQAAALWDSVGGSKLQERLSGEPAVREDLRFDSRSAWIESLKALPDAKRVEVVETLGHAFEGEDLDCPLMTAEQVEALAARSHEIGSHTLTHPVLTTMRADEREEEIQGAKQLLEEWTHREIAGFCYPNGNFDEEVIRQLREAGHEYACTTLAGRNDERADRFELRRIDVTADRVTDQHGRFDALGFRAEMSMMREALRHPPSPRIWQGP
jgi:peptidoglycan/xylan/chitin deacetylase (PgdA/CDA1 family)